MHGKLRFGTDGIRGKANHYPFDTQTLIRLGQAIGLWAGKKFPSNNPKILIASDTRESCDNIKHSLFTGIQKTSAHLIDTGVLPTPAILQIIQNNADYSVGIVISASHNHYKDNGIKLFDATTGKLNAQDEKMILKHFDDITPKPLTYWQNASKTYKQTIIDKFDKKLLANKTIVLDCAHGATYHVAPEIFRALGAHVIAQSTDPNGTNINNDCGALHPKVIQKAVLENKADAGFAFDGDGDRVIAVNKNGTIKDGDDLLALLLQHTSYLHEKNVVGTVMTNYGFETFLTKTDKTLIRAKVGDKYVAEQLANHNALLGGEASGHIILKDYLPTGDGIFVALKTLESIIENDNWEMNTFTKTPQFLLNVPVHRKDNLDDEPYKTLITKHTALLKNGRTVIRYSGTENLLRIMVEDTSEKIALEVVHSLKKELQNALR